MIELWRAQENLVFTVEQSKLVCVAPSHKEATLIAMAPRMLDALKKAAKVCVNLGPEETKKAVWSILRELGEAP